MRSPRVDDYVRLSSDIPELQLFRGEVGIVRSTWFSPAVAYEVEFAQVGRDYLTRALLRKEQVMIEEVSLYQDKDQHEEFEGREAELVG